MIYHFNICSEALIAALFANNSFKIAACTEVIKVNFITDIEISELDEQVSAEVYEAFSATAFILLQGLPFSSTASPASQTGFSTANRLALTVEWVDQTTDAFQEISLYHHNKHCANHSASDVE